MVLAFIIYLFALPIIYTNAALVSPKDSITSCVTTQSDQSLFTQVANSFKSIETLIANQLEVDIFATISTTRIKLYKKDGHVYYVDKSNASSLINYKQPTVVVIHGWQSSLELKPTAELIQAYLNLPNDYNVLGLDWSKVAKQGYLKGCLFVVKHIGDHLADMLEAFGQNSTDFIEKTELVGHSCGAHLAGEAGKVVQQKNHNFARIVGLDAAKPGYSPKNLLFRALQKSDAKFVIGFFTNPDFYGLKDPYAHNNVLFNGECQPQCVINVDVIGSCLCSHFSSILYWTDSIKNPDRYLAATCSDSAFKTCDVQKKSQVGYFTQTGTNGNFFSTVTLNETFNPNGSW